MARLEVKPFEFDARMVEWNLKHGLITQDQLKTYLNSLPDEDANAEKMDIQEDPTSDGGDQPL